jgi:hypothetical protein
VDGNTSTGFNGPDINTPGWINPYIGVDSRPEANTLTVKSGTGSGMYDLGTTVPVSANRPPPGQHFAVWTGGQRDPCQLVGEDNVSVDALEGRCDHGTV